MKEKRNILLFVTSIIMIALASIAALYGLMLTMGLGFILSILTNGAAFSAIFFVFAVMIVVILAINIGGGVIGIINSKKPRKSLTIISLVLAGIIIVLTTISFLLSALTGLQNIYISSILSLLLKLVLPILYIIGTIQQWKKAQGRDQGFTHEIESEIANEIDKDTKENIS